MIMLSMLFSGFLMNKSSIPAMCEWLTSISFFSHAYEALIVNEFRHARTQFTFTAPVDSLVSVPVSGRSAGGGVGAWNATR